MEVTFDIRYLTYIIMREESYYSHMMSTFLKGVSFQALSCEYLKRGCVSRKYEKISRKKERKHYQHVIKEIEIEAEIYKEQRLKNLSRITLEKKSLSLE